jgi:hypothetical protein
VNYRFEECRAASGRHGDTDAHILLVVRQGDNVSHHSDGVDLPDIDAALMEATATTGELLRELALPIVVGSEWRMEVAMEARRPLLSLRVIAELHEKGGIDLQELLKVRSSQGGPSSGKCVLFD